MTPPRFRLPPRAAAPPGIDPWLAAEIRPPPSGASRTAALPVAGPADNPAGKSTPFLPDMKVLLAAHQSNVQALLAANEAVMNGAWAIGRLNMEMMWRAMTHLSESMAAMPRPVPPAECAIRQARMGLRAWRQASADIKDVVDIVYRANIEATEILDTRVTETLALWS